MIMTTKLTRQVQALSDVVQGMYTNFKGARLIWGIFFKLWYKRKAHIFLIYNPQWIFQLKCVLFGRYLWKHDYGNQTYTVRYGQLIFCSDIHDYPTPDYNTWQEILFWSCYLKLVDTTFGTHYPKNSKDSNTVKHFRNQLKQTLTKTYEYRIVSNKRSPSNKCPLTYFQIKLGKMPKFLYGVSL